LTCFAERSLDGESNSYSINSRNVPGLGAKSKIKEAGRCLLALRLYLEVLGRLLSKSERALMLHLSGIG